MLRSPRWRHTARTGRAVARASLLSLLLGAALGGGTAFAGSDAFCSNCTVGPGTVWTGPAHSLTASRGTNLGAGAGCGGAYGYGSYYCADPAGCHTYSGATVLYPAIRHRGTTDRSMNGYSTWGSTPPPSNCVWTSVYRTGGPVSDAATDPDGIPALDREEATAPKAVGALVPAADRDGARALRTPKGDGWVLVDPEQRQVCLVLVDGGAGYGYSCQRFGDVQSAGTLATLEDEDTSSAAGDVVVALAPEGVDALQVREQGGRTRAGPVEEGVAVTTLGKGDAEVVLPKAQDAPAGVKARRLTMAR